MTLEEAYFAVKNRLDTLDFSKLWRGFHPAPFALYDADACFFDGAYTEKTDVFMANTAISYQGRYIAVWDVGTAPEDLDALASGIAHEMFHAFQMESGESRWANEMEALRKYRCSAENLSGKLAEAGLMRRILQNGEHGRFPELLAMRKARAERFPYEYDYESRIEQIEGSAKYVELLALERLDVKKAELRWEKLLKELTEPERYVPARVISYSTGAAFLACIRACSGFDTEAFTSVPFAQEVLSAASGSAKAIEIDPRAEQVIASYQEETKRIIGRALSKNKVVLQGCCEIVSLNIWDARFEGRYAVSNCFVALRDGGKIRSIPGDFVVELDDSGNALAVYEQ